MHCSKNTCACSHTHTHKHTHAGTEERQWRVILVITVLEDEEWGGEAEECWSEDRGGRDGREGMNATVVINLQQAWLSLPRRNTLFFYNMSFLWLETNIVNYVICECYHNLFFKCSEYIQHWHLKIAVRFRRTTVRWVKSCTHVPRKKDFS